MATIGGNLFKTNLKNPDYLHKDSNYLLSVIIILGTDVRGGKTVFNCGKNMNDIRKRAHILKHSRGRCVVGAFDKILRLVSIWAGPKASLSFIIQK